MTKKGMVTDRGSGADTLVGPPSSLSAPLVCSRMSSSRWFGDGLGAGARLEVTNPQLTLTGKHGTLTIREWIEWVGLPDDWSVQTGTWKVVGGTGSRTGTYAGLSGHGRITSVWTHGGYLRVRLFGFLEPK